MSLVAEKVAYTVWRFVMEKNEEDHLEMAFEEESNRFKGDRFKTFRIFVIEITYGLLWTNYAKIRF